MNSTIYSKINKAYRSIALVAFGAAALSASAEVSVTGTVTDSGTGAALPGARVTVVGSQAAAMTGDEGKFNLKSPGDNVILRIEAPGFTSVLIPLRGSDTVNVALQAITVPGFYEDKVLSSTASNTVSDFSVTNVNADEDLTRLMGEVFAIHRSGMPGAGTAVFVDGIHSINSSSQPLYIVDGVEWTNNDITGSLLNGHFNNPLALIDPKDIEDIYVLRDAAATVLYGSRAANGVVVIETRRAKSEATEIEAWATLGVRDKVKTIPVMNASDYRTYVTDVMSGMFENSSYVNRFKFLNDDPTSSSYLATHNNTDWLNLTSRSGILMNYGVNVRGGDDRALYAFSLGYTKKDGSIRETDFDRINIRFNSDINLWKGFKLRFDVAYAQATWHLFNDGIDAVSSPYYLSLVKSPLYHLNVISNAGEVTAKYSDVDELGVGNPMSILDLGIGEDRNYRFNLNVAPSYVFNDKWAVRGLVSYTFDKIKQNSFIPDYGVADVEMVNSNGEIYAVSRNSVKTLMNRYTNFIADLHADYTPLSGLSHDLSFKLGARYFNDSYIWSYGEGHNTSSDYMNSLDNTTSTLRFSDGMDGKFRNLAYYLTADYSFMKRYFITAGVSMESSSRFGKKAEGAIHLGGVSWGLFPAVNAAWVISNEKWMKNAPFINFMKLRAGYSLTGNSNLPDYATRSYFQSALMADHAFGLVLANIGNEKLKWESTGTFRVGLDMNLFSNRWNFALDYYISITRDLLVQKELKDVSGLKNYWSNGGRMRNNGVTFTTNVRALDIKDWKLDVGASIGAYRNKITALSDGDFITEIAGAGILSAVGEPVGVFYGYRTDGVFADKEAATAAGLGIRQPNGSVLPFEAGDMHFVDRDNNKLIDDADRQVIGNPNPDCFGNFNLRLQWKGFTLGTLFTYSVGNDVYNALRANLESGSDILNQSVSMANRWVVNGQQTDIPRATYGDPMGNARFSDRWIEDGSYLRWKSLELSYNIPIRSTFLQGVTVWAGITNLCTWTNYLGADPESFSGNTPLYMGIDNGLIPSTREYNFGVKINL